MLQIATTSSQHIMLVAFKCRLNIYKLIASVHCGVAQRKRVGPITQRTEDRNLLSQENLFIFLLSYLSCHHIFPLYIHKLKLTVHCGVAQRKRVGPITQRTEDRNLLSQENLFHF